MPADQKFSGRTAVVTGGASGLGHAIALALAAEGAAITVVDLPSALARLPEGWRGAAVDLGAPEAKAEVEALAAEMGQVDIVVANAGLVPPWRGVAELDPLEWQRVMAVNVWGVAATLGAFAPALSASRRGAALVMASINGWRAHPRQVLYTASKHAVIGIMRAAALDLGARGVRVNALAPGPVATEALQTRIGARHAAGGPDPTAALAALSAETALGRIATEAEVAAAAVWLLSDAASALTGVVLPVDAGMA